MAETQDMDAELDGVSQTAWVLVISSAVVALILGYLGAHLSGFPLYPGWQGAMAQQYWMTRVAGLLAIIIAVAVSTRVAATLTGWGGSRLPVALGLVALAGFSVRGGTMGSVMQASGGREIFWFLTADLVVLSLVAWGCFSQRKALTGVDDAAGRPIEAGVLLQAIVIQVVVTTGLIWLLGKSYEKPQAMMTVLLASMLGVVAASTVTGQIWKGGWMVPLLIGVAGYLANAVTATGVDTGNIQGMAAGMAMPLPLDYVAMGPIGFCLGELLSGSPDAEEND